jgi:methylmalonyl-CoA mutase N-terminal domain/subunit
VARRRNIPEAALSGTVQNDILKEYAARGTYIYPPAPSLRLVTDVFAVLRAALPKWNVISISGYHMREAGATAPQEIAFTFANALEYCARPGRPGSSWRRSASASRSSSRATPTSWRRWRSFAPRGGCGRAS